MTEMIEIKSDGEVIRIYNEYCGYGKPTSEDFILLKLKSGDEVVVRAIKVSTIHAVALKRRGDKICSLEILYEGGTYTVLDRGEIIPTILKRLGLLEAYDLV